MLKKVLIFLLIAIVHPFSTFANNQESDRFWACEPERLIWVGMCGYKLTCTEHGKELTPPFWDVQSNAGLPFKVSAISNGLDGYSGKVTIHYPHHKNVIEHDWDNLGTGFAMWTDNTITASGEGGLSFILAKDGKYIYISGLEYKTISTGNCKPF